MIPCADSRGGPARAPRRRRRAGRLYLSLLALSSLTSTAGCGSGLVELAGVVERTAIELAAPVSEEVVAIPHAVGERVPAGAVVSVVLSDESPWVRVWLPARTVSRLAPGAAAEVEVEGFDGTLEGVVADVGRESEFTPHYALTERESAHLVYEGRVTLTGAPPDLRPGLPARVSIRLGGASRGGQESGG